MSDLVQLGGLRKRGSLDDHNERLAHEVKKSTGNGGKFKGKGPWSSFALFSVALAVFPLAAYLFSRQYIFNGTLLFVVLLGQEMRYMRASVLW